MRNRGEMSGVSGCFSLRGGYCLPPHTRTHCTRKHAHTRTHAHNHTRARITGLLGRPTQPLRRQLTALISCEPPGLGASLRPHTSPTSAAFNGVPAPPGASLLNHATLPARSRTFCVARRAAPRTPHACTLMRSTGYPRPPPPPPRPRLQGSRRLSAWTRECLPTRWVAVAIRLRDKMALAACRPFSDPRRVTREELGAVQCRAVGAVAPLPSGQPVGICSRSAPTLWSLRGPFKCTHCALASPLSLYARCAAARLGVTRLGLDGGARFSAAGPSRPYLLDGPATSWHLSERCCMLFWQSDCMYTCHHEHSCCSCSLLGACTLHAIALSSSIRA